MILDIWHVVLLFWNKNYNILPKAMYEFELCSAQIFLYSKTF